MTRAFGLGRQEKLKSRQEIEKLFASRASIQAFPLRVKYRFVPAEGGTPGIQVGCTASKSQFKRAVDRNRVKRLVREAYRLRKHMLLDQMVLQQKKGFLFFIYTHKELPDFQTIAAAMEKALYLLQQKSLHENIA